jgi:4-amino-4-deoxychorismate lyase
MSPYIETIKLMNGVLENLSWHQIRFERTRRETLGLRKHPALEQVITIPGGLERGLYKCRVVYGKTIERIEFEPHEKRVVNSLKLVVSETISYGYKFASRSDLDTLYQMRGDCDDILIVKNGCLTDSYYANVVLWDGARWTTPDTPLLPGTMRASLLANGLITEKHILAEHLDQYEKARLINAMNHLRESPDIPVENIIR